MNSLHRNAVLTSLVVGMAVAGAACNQRTPSTTSQNMSTPPSTSSQSTSPPQTAMAPTTPAPTTSNQMSGAVDDASITAKVKSAIMAEPALKSTDINVDTKDGTVTLTGTVPSATLKDRAKEIASSVGGVKSVHDNLVTQSG